MAEQTSADTSVAIISRALKLSHIIPGIVVLDWGCGAYDCGRAYVEMKGGVYIGYDPHHPSDKPKPCDLLVIANVLNVIEDDAKIVATLREASRYLKAYSWAIITVYEGDRSGIGAVTTKGYQRNQRLAEYRPLIRQAFDHTNVKGNRIIASRPSYRVTKKS